MVLGIQEQPLTLEQLTQDVTDPDVLKLLREFFAQTQNSTPIETSALELTETEYSVLPQRNQE